jgi:hypothetical protein
VLQARADEVIEETLLAAVVHESVPVHETVMPVPSPQVRYEEVNGPSSVAVRGQSLDP